MTTETTNALYSDYAVHPGVLLAEEIEARRLTQRELAQQMGRPVQVVNEVIRGKKGITARTALDLERVLGVSARLWMNLQSHYELTLEYNKRKAVAG